MKIITNNIPRDVIYGYELSPEESKEFDYMDDISEGTFFRYKGRLYDIGEFMRISNSIAPHPQRENLENWHGYTSDTFFSGLLVKYSSDFEKVTVATYICD